MKRETTKRLTAMGMSVAMAAGLFTTIGTTAVWAEDSAPKATAADNGIELPELEDGTLHLEVSIADYQQSSDGTLIQEKWQEAMENYLGCKLDITWTRTAATDYTANELVVLQSGSVPDIFLNPDSQAACTGSSDSYKSGFHKSHINILPLSYHPQGIPVKADAARSRHASSSHAHQMPASLPVLPSQQEPPSQPPDNPPPSNIFSHDLYLNI